MACPALTRARRDSRPELSVPARPRAGLSSAQITSLTHGGPGDPYWTYERDRLLIEAADALHDSADIGEDLWHRLAGLFREEQLPGWYHAISFTANGARLACKTARRASPTR